MNFTMRFPGGRAKALTFSYDDGVAQDIRLIDIFVKHGLKGTFNINTGLISKTDAVGGKGRMSDAQLIPLYRDAGMEVAVHASTHPRLESLPAPQITDEILKDRREIERRFGVITRGMAYPYGTYNDTVLQCLRACGIVYSRTTQSTHNFGIPTDWLQLPATCHHNDPRLQELCGRFLEKQFRPIDSCALFYVWGHSYEFDTNDNWNVMEEFAERIGGKEDIWYATNIEIYDYVKAFEALEISLDYTIVKNPTMTDVWVNVGNVLTKFPAGSVTKLG